MYGIGVPELLIVLAIGVLFFGNRIPAVARSLGSSLVQFKRGLQEAEETE